MQSSRPLAFIAHSLGGLVVQQALITARESRSDYLRQIETHTKGICFLGTPHRGASLATWGELAARLLNFFKPVNHQMVSLLEPRSIALHELRRALHNILEERKEEKSRIKIVCFYETIPMFRSCVVSVQSATIDGEPSFPILANHVVRGSRPKMPRRSADSSEYGKICKFHRCRL
jgi:pimeloyl-ACP methyl ester carboxylesterase